MIMKLRKTNLRYMMDYGLINNQVRRQVLLGLKQIVKTDKAYETNGDLKEKRVCQFGCFSDIFH